MKVCCSEGLVLGLMATVALSAFAAVAAVRLCDTLAQSGCSKPKRKDEGLCECGCEESESEHESTCTCGCE